MHNGDKKATANNVAETRRDHRLPDVVANVDVRATEEDGHGDEEHVGDNVIEAERDESKDGPPDAHNLAGDVTRLEGQPTGDADEPVGADGAQEDLVPHWCVGLFLAKGNGLLAVQRVVQDAAVADDDADDEERAGEVAEEGEEPVREHLGDADAAVQRSEGCVL